MTYLVSMSHKPLSLVQIPLQPPQKTLPWPALLILDQANLWVIVISLSTSSPLAFRNDSPSAYVAFMPSRHGR